MAQLQIGGNVASLWDDLCVIPPAGINPTGPDGSMTVISDTAGYLGCLQADAIGESCTVVFQLPHRYMENTDIKPHIHVIRNDATDNTGNVEFEAKFRVTPVIGAASAWTAYVAGDTTNQPADGANNAGMISWTLSDATYNFGISYIIIMVIRRSGTTTGSIALTSADIHGQIGQMGSRTPGDI